MRFLLAASSLVIASVSSFLSLLPLSLLSLCLYSALSQLQTDTRHLALYIFVATLYDISNNSVQTGQFPLLLLLLFYFFFFFFSFSCLCLCLSQASDTLPAAEVFTVR